MNRGFLLVLFAVSLLAGCAEEDPVPEPIPCPEPRPGCPTLEDCVEGRCYQALYACDTMTGEWILDGSCEPAFVTDADSLESR